ncbi:MAG: branched-chain amino acid transaminase [Thermoplasmata archaeon]|nr:branched-chain amino acid transaminase [Thermoplasmata archaeon]
MVGLTALRKIWLDGKLVDWDAARVHVLTHGLHYGYAIFEGIRCHRVEAGSAVFRLDEHLDRFLNSAKTYRMILPFTKAQLHEAIVELVAANRTPEAYIRPIAFSGYGEMGLDPTRCPISVAIGMWPWGAYLGEKGVASGIRATVSSWTRIDSRSLPPQAKCAANYANSALAKMEATAAGYEEAILLNSSGMVAEGPGENIFRIKNGVVSTPPASSGILRGVTRDSVIRLLAGEKMEFLRTDFTREELFTADELFFCGTAAGITPIREVDGRPIGDGQFPITRRLQKLYEDALRGRDPRYRSWLSTVPLPDEPEVIGSSGRPRAAGTP